MKKILVISNNPFSQNDNNGKTLASLFSELNQYEISQLYFSPSKPSELLSTNFYSLKDVEMLSKTLRNFGINFNVFKSKGNNHRTNQTFNSPKVGDFGSLKRIIREFLWSKQNWLNIKFKEWLDSIKPDLVFFLAGDSEFAFNITNFIVKRYNSKLIVYITDDYYDQYGFKYTLLNFRKFRLQAKLKSLLKVTNLLVTISKQMSLRYKQLFKFDSVNFLNSPSNKPLNIQKNGNLMYAGSLGLGRLDTLVNLGKALDKYNSEYKKNFQLHIYSSTLLKSKVINKINKIESIHILGQIDKVDLYNLYNSYSYLVHVESFSKKFVRKTLYSISTKIPEYLNTSSSIIAIGDLKLASIKLIKNYAFLITNRKITPNKLHTIFSSNSISHNRSNLIKKIFNDRKILISNIKQLLSN
jgi:hypothetical protein